MPEYRCRECGYTWMLNRPTRQCQACRSREIREISGDYWRSELYRIRWDLLLETLSKATVQTEKYVIKLLYGIEHDDFYCYSIAQVAKLLGRTPQTVRRLEAKAIRKLRQPVQKRRAQGFDLLSRYALMTMPKGMSRLARRVTARL